jgi:hypothetical protein
MNDEENHVPPPTTNREDPVAYRIAVGAVGAALVVFLIGAAWITADGLPVPTQYWSSGSAIAGALLGILAPTPTKTDPDKVTGVWNNIVTAWNNLWDNRALLILLFVFVASLLFSITSSSAQLQTVAAASGGALIGLLAPPPTSGTSV